MINQGKDSTTVVEINKLKVYSPRQSLCEEVSGKTFDSFCFCVFVRLEISPS